MVKPEYTHVWVLSILRSTESVWRCIQKFYSTTNEVNRGQDCSWMKAQDWLETVHTDNLRLCLGLHLITCCMLRHQSCIAADLTPMWQSHVGQSTETYTSSRLTQFIALITNTFPADSRQQTENSKTTTSACNNYKIYRQHFCEKTNKTIHFGNAMQLSNQVTKPHLLPDFHMTSAKSQRRSHLQKCHPHQLFCFH